MWLNLYLVLQAVFQTIQASNDAITLPTDAPETNNKTTNETSSGAAYKPLQMPSSVVALYTSDPTIHILRPCYAVFIKAHLLITAGKCLYFRKGTYQIETVGGVLLNVSHTLQNPGYEYVMGDFGVIDLGLLKLSIDFDLKAHNISLLQVAKNDVRNDAICHITNGFKIEYFVVDIQLCKGLSKMSERFLDLICLVRDKLRNNITADNMIFKSICKPGAPVICDDVLVGVSPYVEDCSDPVRYVTSLYRQMDWIEFSDSQLNDKMVIKKYIQAQKEEMARHQEKLLPKKVNDVKESYSTSQAMWKLNYSIFYSHIHMCASLYALFIIMKN